MLAGLEIRLLCCSFAIGIVTGVCVIVAVVVVGVVLFVCMYLARR